VDVRYVQLACVFPEIAVCFQQQRYTDWDYMQVAEREWVLPVRTQVRRQHRGALWVLDKELSGLHARSVFYALAVD